MNETLQVINFLLESCAQKEATIRQLYAQIRDLEGKIAATSTESAN